MTRRTKSRLHKALDRHLPNTNKAVRDEPFGLDVMIIVTLFVFAALAMGMTS